MNKKILFAAAIGLTGGRIPAAETPNILVITTDDQGLQLSCYGDPVIQTPHLDALAGDGMLFQNAYVTATSCSPSRSSILTGRYPHQNGQIGLSQLGFKMNKPYGGFPSLAKDCGYYTGVIGKVHVEPIEAFRFDYMNGGFDYLVDGKSTSLVETPVPVIMMNGESKMYPVEKSKSVPSIEKLAGEFLDKAGDSNFCLYLNLGDPHLPWHRQVEGFPQKLVSPQTVQALPFFEKGRYFDPDQVAAYYDACLRVDEMIGRIVGLLRKKGVYENTAILFVSDHGPNFFGRGKGSLYEGGLHVPMIAKLPGVSGGRVVSEYVSTLDIYPTVRALLGAAPDPALPGQTLTGLADGSWVSQDRIFGGYNQHAKDTYKFMRSIRDKQYKLICNPFSALFHGWIYDEWQKTDPAKDDTSYAQNARRYSLHPTYELYDLQADPHEWNNLAADPAYTSVFDKLKDELHDWMTETSDFLLSPEVMSRYETQSKEILAGLFGVDGQGITVIPMSGKPEETVSHKLELPESVRQGQLFPIRIEFNIPESQGVQSAQITFESPDGMGFRTYKTKVQGRCTVDIEMKIPGIYEDDSFSIIGFVGESWPTRLNTIGKASVNIKD